jgi:serine/threonine protein kinase
MSQQFLHYTITSTLERRAAGATYLAVRNQGPARTVVLKIFQASAFASTSEQDTFLQESEKFSLLSNPHIVPMIEAGIEEDQAYIVSEYMPNGSLRVRLDRTYPQRLPIQQAMTILTQIGQGLAYLHARYLIHGQLKPEHILFDANGHALLSDPYCATKPAPWSSDNENASEAYRYLAPEQFEGESSPLSDQYALCCLAYELLTGRPPFTLRDPQALEEQQKYILPSPLSPILPDLSPTVEQAILKGLAKEPSQRHADIITFLSALQASKTATAPDLPLPRSKRRTSSLVPSIPSAPPIPATEPAKQSARATQPQTPPEAKTEDPLETTDTDASATEKESIFASLFGAKIPNTKTSNQEPVAPRSNVQENDPLPDDNMAAIPAQPAAHMQENDPLPDDNMAAIPAQPAAQMQENDQYLEDIFAPPASYLEEDDQHSDDVFAIPATPPALAQASADGTLDELLREMELEEELLMLEKNAYSPTSEDYHADQISSPPADPDVAEDNTLPFSYPNMAEDNALPLSYPDVAEDNTLPLSYRDVEAITPLPTQHNARADNFAAPGSPAITKLSAATALIPAPPQPTQKNKRTQSSSNVSLASLDNIRNWNLISRRTVIWTLLLLLMIGSILTYTTLAAATPKPSSLALFATVTPPTPKATVDQMGILPPVTATSIPTATPTPKPTPTPRPKPKPTPIPTAIPTVAPVYIPAPLPTLAPTPTPKPKPTAVPPTLLYSHTDATESTATDNTVMVFIPSLTVTNVRIEADVVTQGDGGGVIFRSGYRLRIGTDGTYDLVTATTGLASGSSPAIRQGNSVSNHVTIIANGTHITVAVNSTQIINVYDSTYSSGSLGVMAVNFGDPTTTTCVFNVYTD